MIPGLALAFRALPGKPTDVDTKKALSFVREALAWAVRPQDAAAAAGAFASLAPRDVPEVFIQAVVDVLKYPTVGKDATDVLVNAVRNVAPDAPSTSGGLIPFISWTSVRLPGVTLDSPPRCPRPRGSQLHCPAGGR
jgi:hypothetical protein